MVDVTTLGKGLNLSFNLDWPSFSPLAQEGQGFGKVMASCTSVRVALWPPHVDDGFEALKAPCYLASKFLDRSEHRGIFLPSFWAFHFSSSMVIADWQATNRFA